MNNKIMGVKNFIRKYWKLILLVFYLLVPFDLLPESFLGLFGYSDDLFFVIITLLKEIAERRTKKVV